MTKSELRKAIAIKEAELKELKAQLRALNEAERADKLEDEVEISISLEDLENCNTRADARAMLEGLKVKELRAIAKKYEVAGKNKRNLIGEIVEMAIGNRIDRIAIGG